MTKPPLSKKRRREIARKAKAKKRAGDPNAREPNGQLSRRKADREARGELAEKDAMAVAVEARMRQFGLTREQAEANVAVLNNTDVVLNAGTVHGRMRLKGIEAEKQGRPPPPTGALTEEQWVTAEWYIATRSAYMASIMAKGEGQSKGSNQSVDDSAAYVEWCEQIAEMWKKVQDCLQAVATSQRSHVLAAFDVFLFRNYYMEHLERDLKSGLDAISRFPLGRRAPEDDDRGSKRMSEAQLNAMAEKRA